MSLPPAIMSPTLRRATSLLLAAALTAAALPSSAQWTAADVLKDEARVLSERGDFRGAVEKLRLAYAQRPTYEIAANLGVLETKLELWVPAVEHLGAALAAWPASASAESRTKVERALSDARTRVAEIDVRVDRPGARIVLDGAEIGSSPLPRPVVVEPRQHTVRAELAGFRADDVVVIPAAASRGVVEIALRPVEPASPASTATAPVAADVAPPVASSFDAARPWLATSLGVMATGALVGGLVLTVVSNGHAADAEDQIATIPDGSCGEGGPATTCLEIGASLAQRDATASGAIGFFVAGGVAAAALVVVLLVPAGPPSTSPAAARTGLVAGPGDLGLAWAHPL